MAARYEHKIPEGYEARIEGNKVIIERLKSENERIREEIINFLDYAGDKGLMRTEDYENEFCWRRWLEKQKEQKPLSTEETELNSIAFLEQLGYTCIPPGAEQKPTEWDEVDYDEEIADLCDGSMSLTSKDIARHFYELGLNARKEK